MVANAMTVLLIGLIGLLVVGYSLRSMIAERGVVPTTSRSTKVHFEGDGSSRLESHRRIIIVDARYTTERPLRATIREASEPGGVVLSVPLWTVHRTELVAIARSRPGAGQEYEYVELDPDDWKLISQNAALFHRLRMDVPTGYTRQWREYSWRGIVAIACITLGWLLAALLTAQIAARRLRRRIRESRVGTPTARSMCPECGYPLPRITSTCPECGTTVSRSQLL